MLNYHEELLHELRQFPNEIVVLYYASLAGWFFRKDMVNDVGDKYMTCMARLANDDRFGEKELVVCRELKSLRDTYNISESGKRNLKIYFDTNNGNKKKLEIIMKKIMGARVLELLLDLNEN